MPDDFHRGGNLTRLDAQFSGHNHEGLDAARPILMGFSAGGQIALIHYASHPDEVGGLILHGAFPVVPKGHGGGKWKPMEPPTGDAIKAVPILTIYGSQERGGRMWKEQAPKWRKAGVPLEVHVVQGGRHRFYYNGKPGRVVAKWLEAVAKGELPGLEAETPKEPVKNGRTVKAEIIIQPTK